MFRKVMQGPVTNERVLRFRDITLREAACLVPIVVLMFWLGLYPRPVLRKMDASVSGYLRTAARGSPVLVKVPRSPDRLLPSPRTEKRKPPENEEPVHD